MVVLGPFEVLPLVVASAQVVALADVALVSASVAVVLTAALPAVVAVAFVPSAAPRVACLSPSSSCQSP